MLQCCCNRANSSNASDIESSGGSEKAARKVFGTHFEANSWINLDACGLICALVTWILIYSATCLLIFKILRPWSCRDVVKVVGSIVVLVLAGISSFSHLRTMVTDPGSVPRGVGPPTDHDGGSDVGETQSLKADAESLENEVDISRRNSKRWCRKCDSFKPRRAHHCSVCSRCIVNMDHHCPWVNNCVGIGNHKLFLLFIGYTAILCGVSAFLVIYSFALLDQDSLSPECRSERFAGFTVAILSVLFGLFTTCMICDQCYSIYSGTTKVDRLKGDLPMNKYGLRKVNEVWGGTDHSFRLQWMCPTPAKWEEPEYSMLMGFERIPDKKLYNSPAPKVITAT